MNKAEQTTLVVQPSHVNVLKFVKKYIDKRSYAPQINEIAKGVSLTERQVYRIVDELVGAGYLKRELNKKRGLSVEKDL